MVLGETSGRISRQCWFPLRVTYSRELKVKDTLMSDGIECFVPMTVRTDEKGGVKYGSIVPAVNNLCFARASRQMLDSVLESRGMRSFVSYIWDRATREPSIVPDKAMEDFIRISESRYEDVVYLYEVSSRLRAGQPVRVTKGPFAGVEGGLMLIEGALNALMNRQKGT